jgi:hypothetical protein
MERFLLSGILLSLPHERQLLRIVLAMLIVITGAVVTLIARPYKRQGHNYYSVAAHASLQTLYLGGMLVKLHADITQMLLDTGSDPSLAETIVGFNKPDTIATLMLAFTITVLAFVVIVMIKQLTDERRLPIVLCAGVRPTLALVEGQRWHLFLSHVWPHGQDACATIKRRLSAMLAHVRIFLGELIACPASNICNGLFRSQTRWNLRPHAF